MSSNCFLGLRRKYEFPLLPKNGRNPRQRDRQDLRERYVDFSNRKIETLNPYQVTLKRTSAHPNFRGNRSMRTCHGMDYIYQLRGMRWIRFFEVSGGTRQPIRDWSFTDDINSVVTMAKGEGFARESELTNIPLPKAGLRGYRPSDQDKEIVSSFYNANAIPSHCGGSDTSVADDGSFDGSDSGYGTDFTDGGPPRGPYPDEMWETSDDDDTDNSRCPSNPDETPGVGRAEREYGSEEEDLDDDIPDVPIKSDSAEPQSEDDDSDVDSDGNSDNSDDDSDDDGDEGGQDTQPTTQGASTDQYHIEATSTGNDGEDTEMQDDDGLFVPADRDRHVPPITPMRHAVRQDDDDNRSTATSGLFVRQPGGTPSVHHGNNSRSVGNSSQSASEAPRSSMRNVMTPSTAARAASSPSTDMGPPAPPSTVIDLTNMDEDDDNVTIITASDLVADTESLFRGTNGDTGSTVKAESSSDEARRRHMIDLTGEGDNQAGVKRENSSNASTPGLSSSGPSSVYGSGTSNSGRSPFNFSLFGRFGRGTSLANAINLDDDSDDGNSTNSSVKRQRDEDENSPAQSEKSPKRPRSGDEGDGPSMAIQALHL